MFLLCLQLVVWVSMWFGLMNVVRLAALLTAAARVYGVCSASCGGPALQPACSNTGSRFHE
jgi:hypothetical protein